MKYLKILLFLLFIGVLHTNGQNQTDSVIFKVTYNATFKTKQESKIEQDLQALEVGN